MKRFLRGPFRVDGRITRARYWMLSLLNLLGFIVWGTALISLGIAFGGGPDDWLTWLVVLPSIVLLMALMIAAFATGVRRLHDRGRSGWWICAYYGVPLWLFPFDLPWGAIDYVRIALAVAAWLWVLIDLGCLRGTSGPNAYGPDPLAESSVIPAKAGIQ